MEDTAHTFYNILMSQNFVDWYEETFMQHVEDHEAIKKEEILTDIKDLIENNK